MKNNRALCWGRCLGVLLAASWLLAAGPAWAAKLSIVATTPTLASLARSVAGGKAAVISLASGREDPHYLQALPSYLVRARKADLWIKSGMDLEIGWEGPVLDGSRNPAIRPGRLGYLDVSAGVMKLEVPKGKISREMGDVHPAGNPHWWLDPLNGRIAAGSIAKRLVELDPGNARVYMSNLAGFRLELDRKMFGPVLLETIKGARLWALLLRGELAAELKKRNLSGQVGGWYGAMAPFRGEAIVTYHKSWVYFCERFGLRVIAELEPKPGVPPSGSHLQKVIRIAKKQGVKLILMENFYSPKAARLVADQIGAKVVQTTNSVGGDAGAVDYIALMDLIVDRVSRALR